MSANKFPYTSTYTLQGEQIDALLEAGVSKWPQMEGRFPQVGRITFNFDGKAEPGQRIHDDSIQIGGVPVEKDKVYFSDSFSLFDDQWYLKFMCYIRANNEFLVECLFS